MQSIKSKNIQSFINMSSLKMNSMKSLGDLKPDMKESLIETINTTKNIEKFEIIVEKNDLQNQMKIIQWRSKTDAPIVKILFYKNIQKKLLNQFSVIQLSIENYPCKFSELSNLSLQSLIFLLKQSLEGFEKLSQKFDTFLITSQMIFINKNNKCRVWMNEKVMINVPFKKLKLSQRLFMKQVIDIFEEKCLKFAFSESFFLEMKKVNTLRKAIEFIDKFAQTYKIVPSNNSILKKSNQFSRKSPKHLQSQMNQTIKKIPLFITKKQKDNKESNINKSFFSSLKIQKLKQDLSQKNFKSKSPQNHEVSTQNSCITPKNLSEISKDKRKQSTNSFIGTTQGKLQKKKSLNEIFSKKMNLTPQAKPKKDQDLFGFEHKKEFLSNNVGSSQKIQIQSSERVEIKNQQPISFQSKQKKFDSTIFQTKKQKESPIKNGKLGNIKEVAPDNIEQIFEKAIFEKNGWKSKFEITSLLRDTVNSQQQGKETYSKEMLKDEVQLSFLKDMGKVLKESVVIDE